MVRRSNFGITGRQQAGCEKLMTECRQPESLKAILDAHLAALQGEKPVVARGCDPRVSLQGVAWEL
jgi:hypothetical protein